MFKRYLVIGVVGTSLLPSVGCTQPQTVEIRAVPRQEQADMEQRARDLLIAAARSDIDVITCNAIEALVEIAPREGLAEFRAATTAESPLVRFASFVALGEVRDRASAERIRTGLRDADPRVRLAAAFASIRIGDDRPARLLTSTLTGPPPTKKDDADDDANLRADSALLLGRLGNEKVIKWLTTALQNPVARKSSKVEIAIHGALARMGHKPSIDQLIEYITGRYDTLSRLQAMQELAMLSVPQARDALLYRLTSPDDYLELKLLAARALGRIGSDAGFQLGMESARFVASAENDDPNRQARVRLQAALALGDIGDRRALSVLADLARSPDDERIQVAAALAICRICARQQ